MIGTHILFLALLGLTILFGLGFRAYVRLYHADASNSVLDLRSLKKLDVPAYRFFISLAYVIIVLAIATIISIFV